MAQLSPTVGRFKPAGRGGVAATVSGLVWLGTGSSHHPHWSIRLVCECRGRGNIRSTTPDLGGTMTAQGIITAIIIGASIGALGRLVLPGRQSISILLTIVVGIVAALLGTVLANALGVNYT